MPRSRARSIWSLGRRRCEKAPNGCRSIASGRSSRRSKAGACTHRRGKGGTSDFGPSGYGAEATPDLSVGNDPTGEVQVQGSFGFKGPLQVHGIVVTIEANSGAAYRHWPAIKPWVKLVPATAEFGTVNPPLARVSLLSRGAFLQRRCAVSVETHEVWAVRRHISVAQRLPQQKSFHVFTRQQVYRGDRGIRTDVSNTGCR